MTTNNRINLLNAFQTALGILGLTEHPRPEVAQYASERGIIPALIVFRWMGFGVDLIRDIRPTFGLSTNIRISVETGTRPRCEFSVSWPSGGGDVSLALAEASQHLEWVRKVAQAEAVIRYALQSTPKDELEGILKALEQESRETHEAIRDGLEAEG
jgi:hypothetical protein